MNFKWIKVHTHVHTVNSDGKNSMKDMTEAARNTNVDAMFITDHNTMSSCENENSSETDIKVISGIEYTTFWGHIITIGAPYYRWEKIKDTSLNKLADHVHKHNGIIGIAHPMGIGDPVCTGGSFAFSKVDFESIDFIEVWHGITNRSNEWQKNHMFWANKVSKANSITTIYGGDFHKKEDFLESDSFNWIQIDEHKNIETSMQKLNG